MKCKFCKKKCISIENRNLPLFRHLDYTTIKIGLNYKYCPCCDTIFNNRYDYLNERKKFASKKFLISKKSHSEINRLKNKKYFRQVLQVRIIKKLFNHKKKLNILDYGCFDGSLLKELSKTDKHSKFFGIEVSPKYKKIFPNQKNFFFKNDIHEIKEELDLIIFSELIYYIDRPDLLLEKIYKKLGTNSKIYVQTTSLEKNSYYLLSGDQFFFQTDNALRNLFSIKNFKIKKINSNFKKQNIYICSKHKKVIRKSDKLKKDLKNNTREVQALFDDLNKEFNILKKEKLNYIFGTTINAAFVHEAQNNRYIKFLDENKTVLKKGFRNCKVILPSKIKQQSKILLNYKKNNSIYEKILKKNYKFTNVIKI